jgi:hypothetical protein
MLLLVSGQAVAAPQRSGDDDAPEGATAPARRSVADPEAEVERLLGAFADEPTVAEVQRAAVRRAEAEPTLVRSWVRRVRRAGWLPEVQGALAIDGQRNRSTDSEAGTPDRLGQTRSRKLGYDIKLSWDLGRLIFDPNELKVSREAQRVSELRDQIVAHVTRLYFERRRLQLLSRLRSPGTVRAALERRLRIAELTAILEALTGDSFARARRRLHRAR